MRLVSWMRLWVILKCWSVSVTVHCIYEGLFGKWEVSMSFHKYSFTCPKVIVATFYYTSQHTAHRGQSKWFSYKPFFSPAPELINVTVMVEVLILYVLLSYNWLHASVTMYIMSMPSQFERRAEFQHLHLFSQQDITRYTNWISPIFQKMSQLHK